MLIIRLQRVGKKHQPHFRVVLAQKHKSPTKKIIEILGTYNPRNKQFTVKDQERVKYWLSQHVEVSPTVHNLMVGLGLTTDKVKAWRPKKKEVAPEAATAAPKEPSAAEAPATEEQPVIEEKAEVQPIEEAKSEAPTESKPEVPA